MPKPHFLPLNLKPRRPHTICLSYKLHRFRSITHRQTNTHISQLQHTSPSRSAKMCFKSAVCAVSFAVLSYLRQCNSESTGCVRTYHPYSNKETYLSLPLKHLVKFLSGILGFVFHVVVILANLMIFLTKLSLFVAHLERN